MEDTSFFDRMISNLRSTSKNLYPAEFLSVINYSSMISGITLVIQGSWASKIISSRQSEFVQLLHEGQPVAVAFTIKCPFTKHFDKVLEEAASSFIHTLPHVLTKFSYLAHSYGIFQVECPKYPGFCITRQRKDYPYIEIFHSPQQQAANQGKASDANTTKYAVKVLPYIWVQEFFKRHGIQSSEPNEELGCRKMLIYSWQFTHLG
ncbi:hypothetical protein MKW92_014201 [Papaver armeniacum]|nr:hypothetical protein MKW92_014201 [Papaver armeniacum]